ncbi:MAG TPA: hypothetical protein VF937_03960, partial [Chloroflexota bacterium]
MMGLLFALLVVLCGLALNRPLGAPFSLAPVSGLAGIAALTGLATALGLPPLVRTALVVTLALTGVAILGRQIPRVLAAARAARLPAMVLAVAVVIPALMLGASFAGIEAPVSTHDGAFHVETIDNLRRGVAVATWYPLGFHTSVAAVLGLVPWLDTASGTPRVAQGLAILAPLAAFGLGLALGLEAIVAAIGALVLALTWTYPYDYHLWAGWPQGMGVLLLIGLWATALTWLQRPRLPLAVLGGIFAGAVVVSHGTEVYSSVLGLAAIVLVRHRHIDTRALARHLPVAVATAALISAAYLPTLLGWAGAGGATAVGQATADYAAANPDADAGADWLQYIVGVSGAASLLDLPLRVGLILLGLSMRRARVAGAVWAAFVILLLLVDFVDLPPVRSVFVVTYPWLDHDRPRQVAVVLASLLV